MNGRRVDFVDSPDCVYLDGHGQDITVGKWHSRDQLIHGEHGPQAGKYLRWRTE